MSNLYDTTIEMIRQSGLPLSHIASGAGVGHRWLADLMTGRYSDPGVKKIQKIHDFLKASDRVGISKAAA